MAKKAEDTPILKRTFRPCKLFFAPSPLRWRGSILSRFSTYFNNTSLSFLCAVLNGIHAPRLVGLRRHPPSRLLPRLNSDNAFMGCGEADSMPWRRSGVSNNLPLETVSRPFAAIRYPHRLASASRRLMMSSFPFGWHLPAAIPA
jgi:hypothetical protein